MFIIKHNAKFVNRLLIFFSIVFIFFGFILCIVYRDFEFLSL